MKKLQKIALLTALGLASVSAVKAESYGDLLIGFTTGSGNDQLFDLGPLSGLSLGETFSASTLGIASNNNYTFGVVGTATPSDYASNGGFLSGPTGSSDTMWVSTIGTLPATANQALFNAVNTSVNAVLGDFSGGVYNTVAGNSATISSGADNSWNTQTVSGTLNSDLINSYGNINVSGASQYATIWQLSDDNSSPENTGMQLSLSPTGTLTVVPEPSTYALLTVGGIFLLCFRNQFRRKNA